MRVLITGATGLIGREIAKLCLDRNIEVHFLSTAKDKLDAIENCKGFYWNPLEGIIDKKCIDGVDAIINLAGASISKRWTTSYKEVILNSRIQALDVLLKLLKTENHQIEQLLSASAIGIYPDSITNYYDEGFSGISSSFLGKVVQKWEHKMDDFSELGIMISKIRIGLVFAQNGGALPEMVKPVKLGFGAAFGSGQQWQSWIHIRDLSALFVFILTSKKQGVFNAVAPNPVNQNEIIKSIARVIKRPLILPRIPKFMMKFILGEMHVLLIESQRASSKKVESLGFKFDYNTLEPALEDLL